MRCERCRARIRGATWYCPECGAPVRDLNVADSVAGGRWRPAARRVLPILMTVALLALAGGGGWAVWLLASGGRWPLPAATPMPLGSPSSVSTSTAAAAATAAGSGAEAPAAASPSGDAMPPGLPARPGVPVWRILAVSAPPLVDGNLDDWQSPLINATPLAVDKVVFGPEARQDAADLSATAWGAYDGRALYLAVAVRDDRITQSPRGAQLYLGDSLELQVDTDLAGDWDRKVFDADDWHIGLSPGALATGEASPEAWVWRPQARRGTVDLPLAAAIRPDGYVMELALPWRVLGLTPAAGLALGLTVSVSDDDASTPSQESMVSTSAIRRWDDPTTMGLLILGPPKER